MASDVDDHQSLKVLRTHSRPREQCWVGSCSILVPGMPSRHWSPDDFYRGEHRTIFRAMEWLAADNKPLDIVTLAESLEAHGELEPLVAYPI